MIGRLKSQFAVALLAFCVPFGEANANVGVPGPLMHYGASLSISPWQWISVTMIMCIGVEASVFAYSGQYSRPILASAYANTLSLIAGIPLSLLGAVDPTWFVLPTLVSILIEWWVIKGRRRWFEKGTGSITRSPVIWGNVVSNLILVGLLYVAVKKQ